MRFVICSYEHIGDVVRRLMKYYDGVQVVRYEANPLFVRIITTGPRLGSDDDAGSGDAVVPASLPNPPPNCS